MAGRRASVWCECVYVSVVKVFDGQVMARMVMFREKKGERCRIPSTDVSTSRVGLGRRRLSSDLEVVRRVTTAPCQHSCEENEVHE